MIEVIYVAISRGVNVLAEFTRPNYRGNYETVTRLLLRKVGEAHQGTRCAQLIYDEHVFHYRVDDGGITYLCMTDASARSRLPFAFLDDVAETFRACYGARAARAIAFEMQEAFAPVLEAKCDFYLSNRDADAINAVKSKIDETRDIMVDNIDKILERGEKIELLVDKSENLAQQAFRFERQATTLKRSLCCKRCKLYLFLTFVVVILAAFGTALACGSDLEKCSSHTKKEHHTNTSPPPPARAHDDPPTTATDGPYHPSPSPLGVPNSPASLWTDLHER